MSKIISLMVGRELADATRAEGQSGHEEVLKVVGLTRGKAIRNVSFSVRKGEILGFAGLMGAGRTEVARAVFGADPIERGEIHVHGKRADIKRPTDAVRHGLAYLSEDRKHFGLVTPMSVRDNVTYGHPDLTDADVVDALRAANAWEFVEEMGGLAAVIGERGARLSGGQRQRLAIARALVRDPRVLVLDEATSALDTTSERLVQEATAGLMRGRTTLVVAHRLTTIQGADRIAVLRAGRVVEIGSHDELLAADGAYAELQRLVRRA